MSANTQTIKTSMLTNPAFRQIEILQKIKRAQNNKKSGDDAVKKIFRRYRRKPDDKRQTVTNGDGFRRSADQNAERNHRAQGFADDDGGNRVAQFQFIRLINRQFPRHRPRTHSEKIDHQDQTESGKTDIADAAQNLVHADRINKVGKQTESGKRQKNARNFQLVDVLLI